MTFDPVKQEWKRLTKAEVQAIAPIRSDGRPDTFNHLPTRFITQEEAKARGWYHFYVGDVCSYGHKAPRFVSNPRYCVDCKRVRDGRLPIGGKGEAEYTTRSRPYSQRTETPAPGAVVVAPAAPTCSPLEKNFLTKYAELRDFGRAAREVGKTEAYFQARLSYSKIFREAVEFLEDQNQLAHVPSATEDFKWDDTNRVILQRIYVNTGDLNQAIASIGATNWDYEAELRDNQEFRETMADLEPVAHKVLGRKAVSGALGGDSRLMPRVLEAKLPEYSQRLNVNMNVTGNLTDDQLNQRLFLALEQLTGGRILSAGPADAGADSGSQSRGALEAPADDRGEDSEGSSE